MSIISLAAPDFLWFYYENLPRLFLAEFIILQFALRYLWWRKERSNAASLTKE